MNTILFHSTEVEHPLSRKDVRASHIVGVLRLQPGDTFDAGLIDGPMGKGTLVAVEKNFLTLFFVWGKPSSSLYPIHLLIGLPRPQTSRDILRDMTSLGVASMHFIRSERGEPGYASSTLWKSEEWRKCVINGAAQAFCTQLPVILQGESLIDAIASLPTEASRVALDNYEGSGSLSSYKPTLSKPVIIALGSERGWSPAERVHLRNAAFTFVHLGPRVLRTEVACIAAVTLIKSALGLV